MFIGINSSSNHQTGASVCVELKVLLAWYRWSWAQFKWLILNQYLSSHIPFHTADLHITMCKQLTLVQFFLLKLQCRKQPATDLWRLAYRHRKLSFWKTGSWMSILWYSSFTLILVPHIKDKTIDIYGAVSIWFSLVFYYLPSFRWCRLLSLCNLLNSMFSLTSETWTQDPQKQAVLCQMCLLK